MKKTTKILLPTEISFKDVSELIELFYKTGSSMDREVEIQTDNVRFYEIVGIVVLKIMELDLIKKGYSVNYSYNSNSSFINYLSRMNYFFNHEDSPSQDFISHPANNRFSELVKSERKNQHKDLEGFVSTFRKMTNEEYFINSLKYSFGEILSNIIDHSNENYGLLMAQNYQKKGYLQVCLADNGIGIKKSLETKFNFERHIDAIIKALDKKITSAVPSKAMYSGKTNVGLGLYFSKRICEELNWELLIISGAGCFHKERFERITSTEYKDSYFPGTLVSLKCYYDNFPLYNYSELMDILRAEVEGIKEDSLKEQDEIDWDDIF